MHHCIKIHPQHFPEVRDGKKPYEIRRLDRDYDLGDILILQEWDPETLTYTGAELKALITHIIKGAGYGLQNGYGILSIKLIGGNDDGH